MSGVRFTVETRIAKADPTRQLAYGVVLEPRTADDPDAQGDWYTAEDVELAAHHFMAEVTKGTGFGDLMHDETTRAGYPVESWITPVDFQLGAEIVKAGSWVMGMHYPDPEIWGRIVKGELAAFSVGGSGKRITEVSA